MDRLQNWAKRSETLLRNLSTRASIRQLLKQRETSTLSYTQPQGRFSTIKYIRQMTSTRIWKGDDKYAFLEVAWYGNWSLHLRINVQKVRAIATCFVANASGTERWLSPQLFCTHLSPQKDVKLLLQKARQCNKQKKQNISVRYCQLKTRNSSICCGWTANKIAQSRSEWISEHDRIYTGCA